MNKSSFFIVGQHAVIEALRNPKRKVLRVFLTEESKKNKRISIQNLTWCGGGITIVYDYQMKLK